MGSLRRNHRPSALSPELPAALGVLRRGCDYAVECRCDPWDFAVTAVDLRALGLTTNDLRYLLHKGYVHHAVEKTKPKDKRRVFGPLDRAVFTEKSAFVLTAGAYTTPRQPQVPFYDRELRELWLGGVLVKRFRRPAELQHTILSSFQELGWPRRIDDPLPTHHDQVPKLRLKDTIKRLNQNHKKRSIRFRGGGTGLEIIWALRSHR
jgi:hypothetical protein